MDSKIVGFLFLIVLLAGIQNQATAFSLGYPDISFDSSQGAGANMFSTQGVHFDPSTGYLAVSSIAQSISYDGITFTPLINATVDYRVSLISESTTPYTVTGVFGTSNGSPADLVIQDGSGILLAGTFSSFVLTGNTMSPFNNIGYGVATFNITGGILAGDFGASGGMVNLDFNVTPGFTSTSFTQIFGGSVKGDIAPVMPIPSTMLLMGTGLILFSFLRFQKIKQPS